MSTNFYFRDETAAEYAEDDHIGMATQNLFMFQAIVPKGLTSFKSWMAFLAEPGRVIVDECNHVWTSAEFARRAALGAHARHAATYSNSPVLADDTQLTAAIHRYRDAQGYLFANYVFC